MNGLQIHMGTQIRVRSLTRRRRRLLLSLATACVLLPWMAGRPGVDGSPRRNGQG